MKKALLCTAALAFGCNGDPSRHEAQSISVSHKHIENHRTTATSTLGKGYDLDLSTLQSLHGEDLLGLESHASFDGRFRRTTGSNATFTQDLASGASGMFAHPRGAQGAYTRTETAHADAVLDLFMDLGLPREQLGEVRTDTIVQGGVEATGDGVVRSAPQLAGHVSRVVRYVDGTKVIDSIAVAALNSDGSIQHLQVYWPEITPATVEAAKAMTSASPTLPEVELVIRHSRMGDDRPHQQRAVFERKIPGENGKWREEYYDENGQEVSLGFLRGLPSQ